MAGLKGIDVSENQGDVNWERVARAGIHWAGVKATEGEDHVDHYFTAGRIKAMRDAGVVPMPYHYLRFRTDRPGAREAEHALRVIGKAGWTLGVDLPLALDLEWKDNERMLPRLGASGAHEYASDFARKVQAETGREVVTYLSPGFAASIANKHPEFGSFSWVAAWDAPDGRPPTPVGFPSDRVVFHQISASGTVADESPVDVDLFLGDEHALAAFIRESHTTTPSAAIAPPFAGTPLAQGSRGDAVRVWQAQMKHRGWTITVDGVFGPGSERVARAFQQEKGLAVDGVVGPSTWKAAWEAPITRSIRPQVASIGGPAALSPGTAPPFAGTPLAQGSRGDAVRVWQAQMKHRGWTITVDGVFGPGSERVARAFQQEKGLAVDGVVGPNTWKAAWEASVTKSIRPQAGSIGRSHPEVQPAIAALAQRIVDTWPKLVVTSTTGGSHAKGSLHYSGRAIDLAVSYAHTPPAEANAYMARAAQWVDQHLTNQLAEGIHNPGLSVDNQRRVNAGVWGQKTWDGHTNHIHVAR